MFPDVHQDVRAERDALFTAVKLKRIRVVARKLGMYEGYLEGDDDWMMDDDEEAVVRARQRLVNGRAKDSPYWTPMMAAAAKGQVGWW